MSTELGKEWRVDEQTGLSSAQIWGGWFFAWLGTTVAGAIFGGIAGSAIGLFVGLLIAGFYAVPVVATFAVLTWACWLTRYIVFTAALAGACTGLLSTSMLWDSIFNTDYPSSLVLAGCIGASISAMFTGYYWSRLDRSARSDDNRKIGWQFSLRDMFIRFSVVTALIAAWTFALSHYLDITTSN